MVAFVLQKPCFHSHFAVNKCLFRNHVNTAGFDGIHCGLIALDVNLYCLSHLYKCAVMRALCDVWALIERTLELNIVYGDYQVRSL